DCGGGRRGGHSGIFGADPHHGHAAVRRERDRSTHLRRRNHRAGAGGAGGKLHPRAAGDEGRSDGGVEVRMKLSAVSYQLSAKARTGGEQWLNAANRWLSAKSRKGHVAVAER